MSIPYFYINQLDTSGFIHLPEETSKHCIQVLRMKTGELLLLTDGLGNLATAVITDPDRRHCGVTIREYQSIPPAPRKVSVAVSLLKNAARFEWFLEKGTEIGVTEIIPLISERTEKQHSRMERLRHIVISAMLQSRQAWLPVVHDPMSFSSVVSSSPYELKLVAHCEEGNTKLPISSVPTSASVQILIGPEGDFSPAEIALAIQQGYRAVSLGTTRLRSETAAVVATTLLVNQPSNDCKT